MVGGGAAIFGVGVGLGSGGPRTYCEMVSTPSSSLTCITKELGCGVQCWRATGTTLPFEAPFFWVLAFFCDFLFSLTFSQSISMELASFFFFLCLLLSPSFLRLPPHRTSS